MKPIRVDIIAYAPTQYYHCQHCEFVWKQADVKSIEKFHTESVESSIPQDMMQEYRTLSDWVIRAVERYGGRVVFKVVDAASMEGLVKSVRYGVHRYPAVVVEGQARPIGADFSIAEGLIDRCLA